MANWTVARRVLTPMPVVRLYYYWKFRTRISPRAEVELTSAAAWGADCTIGAYTKVKIPGPFTMGRGVRIRSGCFIDAGWAGLSIGDESEIGPNSSIVAVSYRTERLDKPLAEQGLVTRGIRIGSRVRLGPACVVLDGAEIADDQVVPPCTVVRGPYAPTGGKRLTPSRVVLPDR